YGTANLPGFTFIPPPTITSFTPTNAQAGSTVTISGNNFTGVTAVSFGGIAAQSFSLLSSTSISAIIADGASGYIEVVTPGGKAKSPTWITFTAPTLTSFNPSSGNAGTTVTITGTNFRRNPTDNVVYFGAAKATVTSAANNRLTVIVPPGTTQRPITVATNNFTCYSDIPFSLTYPDRGEGITTNSFTWKAAFRSMEDPEEFLLSDLDGDGKSDLVTQNDFASNGTSISFLRNTSANDSISFASYQDIASDFPWNTPARIDIGDIDGDGRPDIVLTNVGQIIISIFRNTSQPGSISFAPKVDLAADVDNPGIALGDFDGDGKTDIGVTGGGSAGPDI